MRELPAPAKGNRVYYDRTTSDGRQCAVSTALALARKNLAVFPCMLSPFGSPANSQ